MRSCSPSLGAMLAAASVLAALAALVALAADGAGASELEVTWKIDRRLPGVRAVFAHPTLPATLAVSTSAGLVLSSDGGRSFRAPDAARAARLGGVSWVTFAPDSPCAFYLATDAGGLWVTKDGARTLRQLGSTRLGMASDSVRAVFFYPRDPSFRTLLAVHGEEAAGISRSDDGGKTWRVTTRGFHVFSLCYGETRERSIYYMIGAKKDSPEVLSVWSSPGLGDYWYEILRDVLPTDGVHSVARLGRSYWSTMDSGLYRFEANWSAVMPERAGPEDADEWSSVGVAPGRSAGSEIVYAYEPRRFGFVVSEDGFETFTSQSRGLLVGPYVRDGAHVRANANGTAFFAAINGAFYRGRVGGGGLAITDVTVGPALLTYARNTYVDGLNALDKIVEALPKERRAAVAARALVDRVRAMKDAFSASSLTVRACVEGDTRPASVSVDLTVLGGASDEAMLDDGRHGDGEAGDGCYAARIGVRPTVVVPERRDRWRDLRGTMELRVTAVSEDGKKATAPGIFSVRARRESIVFWDDTGAGVAEREGQVTATVVKDKENQEDEGASLEGEACLKIVAGPGPWRMSFGSGTKHHDITGYHALSFWVGTAPDGGAAYDELYVHLADRPENSFSVSTGRVAVDLDRPSGRGDATSGYRRVVVPFAALLQEAGGFQQSITTFVGFSGEARSARTYWIDDIRFFVSEEDLEVDRRRVLAAQKEEEEEAPAGGEGPRSEENRRRKRGPR